MVYRIVYNFVGIFRGFNISKNGYIPTNLWYNSHINFLNAKEEFLMFKLIASLMEEISSRISMEPVLAGGDGLYMSDCPCQGNCSSGCTTDCMGTCYRTSICAPSSCSGISF